MFEKKQIIYSETMGLCQVDNIVSLSATRGEAGVPYYVLRSLTDKTKVSIIRLCCVNCLAGRKHRRCLEPRNLRRMNY
jgi:hypothetical protein